MIRSKRSPDKNLQLLRPFCLIGKIKYSRGCGFESCDLHCRKQYGAIGNPVKQVGIEQVVKSINK